MRDEFAGFGPGLLPTEGLMVPCTIVVKRYPEAHPLMRPCMGVPQAVKRLSSVSGYRFRLSPLTKTETVARPSELDRWVAGSVRVLPMMLSRDVRLQAGLANSTVRADTGQRRRRRKCDRNSGSYPYHAFGAHARRQVGCPGCSSGIVQALRCNRICLRSLARPVRPRVDSCGLSLANGWWYVIQPGSV